MTSIFDPAHPHYEVHKAFVEGSFANPTNPPQVESSIRGGPWYPTANPLWNVGTCYRFKPRMLTRTVTYPEPMREALAKGTKSWFVLASYKSPYQAEWHDCAPYRQILNNGMCFTNEADAQTCYDALFGEQK